MISCWNIPGIIVGYVYFALFVFKFKQTPILLVHTISFIGKSFEPRDHAVSSIIGKVFRFGESEPLSVANECRVHALQRKRLLEFQFTIRTRSRLLRRRRDLRDAIPSFKTGPFATLHFRRISAFCRPNCQRTFHFPIYRCYFIFMPVFDVQVNIEEIDNRWFALISRIFTRRILGGILETPVMIFKIRRKRNGGYFKETFEKESRKYSGNDSTKNIM